MKEFYIITNCPKCGIEIPVFYGQDCGFDCVFDLMPKAICLDLDCSEEFIIDLNTNAYKSYMIESSDFKFDTDDFNVEKYYDYYDKLIKCIKEHGKTE